MKPFLSFPSVSSRGHQSNRNAVKRACNKTLHSSSVRKEREHFTVSLCEREIVRSVRQCRPLLCCSLVASYSSTTTMAPAATFINLTQFSLSTPHFFATFLHLITLWEKWTTLLTHRPLSLCDTSFVLLIRAHNTASGVRVRVCMHKSVCVLL